MANTGPVLGGNVIHQLINAEKQINAQIQQGTTALEQLKTQRDQLHSTIQTFNQTSKKGFTLHTRTSAHTPTQSTGKRTRRRNLEQLPLKGVAKKGTQKSLSTTMDMVRQVLNNHGKEMAPELIREQIIADFGVQPASSMTQMLYKRSRKNSSFYRLADGTYGLLEWKGATSRVA